MDSTSCSWEQPLPAPPVPGGTRLGTCRRERESTGSTRGVLSPQVRTPGEEERAVANGERPGMRGPAEFNARPEGTRTPPAGVYLCSALSLCVPSSWRRVETPALQALAAGQAGTLLGRNTTPLPPPLTGLIFVLWGSLCALELSWHPGPPVALLGLSFLLCQTRRLGCISAKASMNRYAA